MSVESPARSDRRDATIATWPARSDGDAAGGTRVDEQDVLARLERFAQSPAGILLRLERFAQSRGGLRFRDDRGPRVIDTAAEDECEPSAAFDVLVTSIAVVQLAWLVVSCMFAATATIAAFALLPVALAFVVTFALAAFGVAVKSEISAWAYWWLAGVGIGLLLVYIA